MQRALREAKKATEKNFIGLANYQIRYYFRMDPDLMDDDEWANALAYLERIRRMEKEGKF